MEWTIQMYRKESIKYHISFRFAYFAHFGTESRLLTLYESKLLHVSGHVCYTLIGDSTLLSSDERCPEAGGTLRSIIRRGATVFSTGQQNCRTFGSRNSIVTTWEECELRDIPLFKWFKVRENQRLFYRPVVV
ncbi:hypothetical protein R1flu_024403 [Riccia fluitans]|uniref:Uncharacterized protein n=1 Tax=Riccia fluitans TaxID=41844 RepID=A0ABD1XUS7_9MARC